MVPLSVSPQAPAQSFSVSFVVSSTLGSALPYATVEIVETGAERFTNANGEMYFSGLAEGNYHIRVRQLGYSALDTAITLGPRAPNPRIAVRMVPIAFLLERIVVTGTSKCDVPTDLADPKNTGLALILGEVTKNAERHNLLLSRYPLRYRFAREFSTATKFLGIENVRHDTIEFASIAESGYQPGSIVFRDSSRANGTEWMRLPQLNDLADTTFRQNHCFAYRGPVRRDGETQHQIAFIPLGSLTEPDVEGSIFIDTKSYVLRSAVFRLTGGDKLDPPLPETEVRTTFKEIYPNIVLFDRIEGVQPMFRRSANGRGAYEEVKEKQRLIGFNFVRGGPDDVVGAVRSDSIIAAIAIRDSLRATLGSVGGRVFALDKTPIAMAKIVGGDAGRYQAVTDNEGKFILAGLPPGDMEITISAPGFSTSRIFLEVRAGTLVTVVLILYPEN